MVVPVPKFVPVPPVPVHQVTTAFVPTTPFAVKVEVADEHIGLAAAVAEVMPTLLFTVAVTAVLVDVQPVATIESIA